MKFVNFGAHLAIGPWLVEGILPGCLSLYQFSMISLVNILIQYGIAREKWPDTLQYITQTAVLWKRLYYVRLHCYDKIVYNWCPLSVCKHQALSRKVTYNVILYLEINPVESTECSWETTDVCTQSYPIHFLCLEKVNCQCSMLVVHLHTHATLIFQMIGRYIQECQVNILKL